MSKPRRIWIVVGALTIFAIPIALVFVTSYQTNWVTPEVFGYINFGSAETEKECISVFLERGNGDSIPIAIEKNGRFHIAANKESNFRMPGDTLFISKIVVETCEGKRAEISMALSNTELRVDIEPTAYLILVYFSAAKRPELRARDLPGLVRRAIGKNEFEKLLDFKEFDKMLNTPDWL